MQLYKALGFPGVKSQHSFLALEVWWSQSVLSSCSKLEVKMTRIIFNFTVYRSRENSLENGRVKSKMFRTSSLNLTFDQSDCDHFESTFARPSLKKAVLHKVFQRSQKVMFNNSFEWCLLLVIINKGTGDGFSHFNYLMSKTDQRSLPNIG